MNGFEEYLQRMNRDSLEAYVRTVSASLRAERDMLRALEDLKYGQSKATRAYLDTVGQRIFDVEASIADLEESLEAAKQEKDNRRAGTRVGKGR